jgi:hypothetical protein
MRLRPEIILDRATRHAERASDLPRAHPVTGKPSETWPEIDRNVGRLHFGMVAGFKSERWPASRRNTRPE